ncbi:MAG: hypothetical protein AAB074_14280 [Planctomycetota bacterium]
MTPALAEDPPRGAEFTAPVRLKAAGEFVRTEEPGYAAPCWADADGDGRKDLIVGQFSGGKMKVYRNLGEGKLAEGRWLEAEGKVAEVPGVW